MRSSHIAALFTLVFAPAVWAQNGSHTAQSAATITPVAIKQHIDFLASDALKGRDTPSPGLDMAAQYLADQFKALGLAPAGDSGSFIQHWTFTARKPDISKLSAELMGKAGKTALAYGTEYFVVRGTMSDSLVGEIFFVGDAAAQLPPNPAYAGNIVAFTIQGGGPNQVWQANAQRAAMNAITGGARGIVLLLDPEFDADEIAATAASVGGQQLPVPLLAVRNDAARAWLKGSDIDLGGTPVAGKPVAGVAVRVRIALTTTSAPVPNVVGILPGSDATLKDSYVVFSAHMDHVGVSKPNAQGDSIYNGADDDASGTAAVVQVARAFASLPERPKRSLLFVLVSGEEKGLFGSRYFVSHPPVPIEKMVADINMDMVGRNSPDSTVAIGLEFTSLGQTVQSVAAAHPELKLIVAPDLWPKEHLFTRSDHYSFALKKIPAIFFTSGLHPDYHKPTDEPKTIDADKLARTAQLVFWLGNEVANNVVAPTWTAAGLEVIRQTGGPR